MKKKLSMKKTNSIFLFLMQSYGDFQQIPRKCANSSSTCVDKRLIFGQIEENDQKVVHCLCCLRLICYICRIK